MKVYRVSYINKNGGEHPTWGDCDLEGTELTKKRLTAWAIEWGHTILWDTYEEFETKPNPEFVESCLNDIKISW